MRKASLVLVIFLSLPLTASAQSIEWLQEHGGQIPSSIPAAALPQGPQNTNDGLEQKVRSYFEDAPLMAEIARCESRFRQFDSAGAPLDGGSGSMIGLFQINALVHADFAKSLGMDIYAAEGNLAYARYLYQKEGTTPWLSSFSCWHNASPTNAPPSTLTQDLLMGTISPEVKALQVILNGKGFTLAAEGPGSPGQETEKFGLLTRSAVRKFQCAQMNRCSGDEHSTGYGLVDASTRSALTDSQTQDSQTSSAPDQSEEIVRLQKMIADLTAQLFALQER